ncbi:Phosphonoacetaldehyde hydrolase [Posidoniimonas polymericola]|uniref:Phosphonoacetaldehyde hydrolase n=1 Tax=Posidoniimonas polymericola TaxID=2528002 RepID=A0A5C5YMI5_9BACT|nr:phosphonoacetaldehyde hydrolase [Posidoniimonas polymericola]TWT76049.1 Phosphonoacetaldehyde hydrolase [Posidoniimonas polymericola]
MAFTPPDRLAAVIFDWAGVTVDFGSRAPVLAMLAAFEEQGVPVTEREVRAHMGKAKREHLSAILELPRVRDAWEGRHGKPAEAADLDRIYEGFLHLQEDCITSHSDLIDGCLETVAACRSAGMQIGSSTGYTPALLRPVAERAAALGYRPDATVCAGDVSPGRPEPWLCFENARLLGVFPMSSVVKVDDTPAGVTAGRNAGAWVVGVVVSGNEVGLSLEQWHALSDADQLDRRSAASERLQTAGAHLLIDTIADLPGVITEINSRLGRGETP